MKKFNPYLSPYKPRKPDAPSSIITATNYNKSIRVCDSDEIELNGTFSVEFDLEESCISLYYIEKMDNPNYESQLKDYQKKLSSYKNDLAKYKKELKDWKAQKKIWDAQKKEKDITQKRKLLEKLKKELGET